MGVRRLLIWEVRGRICFIKRKVFEINDTALYTIWLALGFGGGMWGKVTWILFRCGPEICGLGGCGEFGYKGVL